MIVMHAVPTTTMDLVMDVWLIRLLTIWNEIQIYAGISNFDLELTLLFPANELLSKITSEMISPK